MNLRIGAGGDSERWVAIILMASIILLLALRNAISVGLVLLLVMSFVYFSKKAVTAVYFTGRDLAFATSMAGLFVATVISQASHKIFDLAPLDGPSRFLLVIPIYLMLREMPQSFPKMLEYAFPLSVWAGFFTSIFLPWRHLPLPGTYFVDPTNFGATILILGFLSLTSINWTGKDSFGVLALKFSAFAIAVTAALRTGERGVWLAIPPLFLIWMIYRLPRRTAVAAIVVAAVAVFSSYLFVPKVSERVAASRAEIAAILAGNLDTSAGQRLQVWKVAIEAIRENPIIGLGPTGAHSALQAKAENGQLTSLGLRAGLSQIHSEIIAHTMRLGVFGLISILAVYAVPLILFWNGVRCADHARQVASVMGLQFVTGYFVVGLTIEVFNLKMFATFYAMAVSILLVIAIDPKSCYVSKIREHEKLKG